MDDFTRAYIHAAAWTEDPDPGSGEYPEPDHADISPAFLAQAERDCAAFQSAFGYAIDGRECAAGRDFWLTRNGHGAGFWDGDWPEPAASILTDGAHSFGEYSGDVFADGREHGSDD